MCACVYACRARLEHTRAPYSQRKAPPTPTTVERLSKNRDSRHVMSAIVGLRLPQKGMPRERRSAGGLAQSLLYRDCAIADVFGSLSRWPAGEGV
eukprot:scaffold13829_cov128-Isochrysis_galbana.AAC.6